MKISISNPHKNILFKQEQIGVDRRKRFENNSCGFDFLKIDG